MGKQRVVAGGKDHGFTITVDERGRLTLRHTINVTRPFRMKKDVRMRIGHLAVDRYDLAGLPEPDVLQIGNRFAVTVVGLRKRYPDIDEEPVWSAFCNRPAELSVDQRGYLRGIRTALQFRSAVAVGGTDDQRRELQEQEEDRSADDSPSFTPGTSDEVADMDSEPQDELNDQLGDGPRGYHTTNIQE